MAVSLASCVAPFADNPYLPLEHAEALSLVVRLTERSRVLDKGGGRRFDGPVGGEGGGGAAAAAGGVGLPSGLHSSLKYCTKKNGLGKAAAEVKGEGAGRGGWLAHCAAEMFGKEGLAGIF